MAERGYHVHTFCSASWPDVRRCRCVAPSQERPDLRQPQRGASEPPLAKNPFDDAERRTALINPDRVRAVRAVCETRAPARLAALRVRAGDDRQAASSSSLSLSAFWQPAIAPLMLQRASVSRPSGHGAMIIKTSWRMASVVGRILCLDASRAARPPMDVAERPHRAHTAMRRRATLWNCRRS
jgi:hypothetical protein